MNTSKYMLCAAALAAIWAPVTLKAQSCNAFISSVQEWQAASPSFHLIHFTLVSNRSDGAYTTYAEGKMGSPGTLQYIPGIWLNPYFYLPEPIWQGNVVEYFSNRRYDSSGEPLGLANGVYPFNPLSSWFGTGYQNEQAAANLTVTISLSNPVNLLYGVFGTVTLTSIGTSQSFTPSCNNGLLYGFVTNSGVTTIFAMSLVEVNDFVP